jgi:hypothetical protein
MPFIPPTRQKSDTPCPSQSTGDGANGKLPIDRFDARPDTFASDLTRPGVFDLPHRNMNPDAVFAATRMGLVARHDFLTVDCALGGIEDKAGFGFARARRAAIDAMNVCRVGTTTP